MTSKPAIYEVVWSNYYGDKKTDYMYPVYNTQRKYWYFEAHTTKEKAQQSLQTDINEGLQIGTKNDLHNLLDERIALTKFVGAENGISEVISVTKVYEGGSVGINKNWVIAGAFLFGLYYVTKKGGKKK